MFPGRPVPQQQNPWELAPEVYVARGRNLGRDEGYGEGHDQGYDEGYHEGWNDAVDKANRVINQQKQMMQDLQQQVQARVEMEPLLAGPIFKRLKRCKETIRTSRMPFFVCSRSSISRRWKKA